MEYKIWIGDIDETLTKMVRNLTILHKAKM